MRSGRIYHMVLIPELLLKMSSNQENVGCTASRERDHGDGTTQFHFSIEPSLERLRQMQEKFTNDRNWDQFHSPRNLLLAMVAEVGELSEIFQWKGEVKEGLPDFTEEERMNVGQELADVLTYLMELSQKCKIDLPAVTAEKMKQNALKYPVEKVHGKAHKYTYYTNSTSDKN